MVPIIAAELWGVPVDDVYGRIAAGQLASRSDYGFVVVDVAPAGDRVALPPRPRAEVPRVLTSTCSVGEGSVSGADIGRNADAEASATAPADGLASSAASLPSDALDAAELDALGGFEPPPPPVVAPSRPRVRKPAARRPATSPSRAIAQRPLVDPAPSADHEPEHEDGPDPNYGEADDGKPLDWRQTRKRVATTRRPPPRF